MKKVLSIFALLIVVVGATFYTQSILKGGQLPPFFKKTPVVTINSHSFKVTVASSQKDLEIGLSETKSLPQDQGMLFLFQKPGYYSFWMKNMKFPIDIIYINNDTIVTIINNAQVPSNQINLPVYIPTGPLNKVLEIGNGLAQKYNFKNGDKVTYENLGN